MYMYLNIIFQYYSKFGQIDTHEKHAWFFQ